jgi:hypothetical protein
MVIRTEYRGQKYSMGSSDPLPVGFEIRFGSLNFQATGYGYLMRITNRDELRGRCQTGADPASVAPTTHAPASAQMDASGPSAPRRCRRSGQRSRQAPTEHRRAVCTASQRGATTGETAAAPTGERSVSGPRFPSVCAAPRRRMSPPPTPKRRHTGFALAAMFRPSGIPALPPTTSRPTAPPASYHPPPRTGTRSGTFPACLT